MEEFLRAYAPVTMARLVKENMHWQAGDEGPTDLLSFPAANRDPAQFDRAGEVVIDREVDGTPRSASASTAASDRTWADGLRVALEVWLERITDFSLDDPSAVTWSAGQIRGPRTLPLRLR